MFDAALPANVCRRHEVKELALCGSAVRGEMRPDSDVDIMVEFEPGARVGVIEFERLREQLKALVERRVDLVTKRGLKPWVRASNVLKDALTAGWKRSCGHEAAKFLKTPHERRRNLSGLRQAGS